MSSHLISCPITKNDPYSHIEGGDISQMGSVVTFLNRCNGLLPLSYAQLRAHSQGEQIDTSQLPCIRVPSKKAANKHFVRMRREGLDPEMRYTGQLPSAFFAFNIGKDKTRIIYPRLFMVGGYMHFSEVNSFKDISVEAVKEIHEDEKRRVAAEKLAGCPPICPRGERPIIVVERDPSWDDVLPYRTFVMAIPQPGAVALTLSYDPYYMFHGPVETELLLPQAQSSAMIVLPHHSFFLNEGGPLKIHTTVGRFSAPMLGMKHG